MNSLWVKARLLLRSSGTSTSFTNLFGFPSSWSVVKHGFLKQIYRVSIKAYGGARFISLGGLLHGPRFSEHGTVAGCSFATAFIRAY
eukprot:8489215-Pyramimonas_sp.AAC.1